MALVLVLTAAGTAEAEERPTDPYTGEVITWDITGAGEEEALAALKELYGVGTKVANCVLLFGLHHLNAFPVDVWIKKVLEEQYPGGYPYEEYSPWNGIYVTCQSKFRMQD